MRKTKTFEVTIEQVYAETYKIKAKTESEARKLAWRKYKPKRKLYRFWINLTQF